MNQFAWTPAMNAVPLRAARPFRPVYVAPKPVYLPTLSGKEMGQKGAIAALGVLPLLLGGTIAAGTAWVGFSTGAREKGLLSAVGYVVGSLGALGALFSVLGSVLWVAGVSMIPEEEFRAPRSAPMVSAEPTAPIEPMFPEIPAEIPQL